jgi:drug/metabolite transporter (DMT)-like permease
LQPSERILDWLNFSIGSLNGHLNSCHALRNHGRKEYAKGDSNSHQYSSTTLGDQYRSVLRQKAEIAQNINEFMNKGIVVNDRGAAISMVAGMLVVGFIDNFIVFISETIGLWQFQITRAAIALPLVFLLAWFGAQTLRPNRLWPVALRSAFLAVSMLFYFWSLALIPMAQALAGLFTSPIFILLISGLILRQRIGPMRILAVVIGFVGIIFVVDTHLADLSFLSFLPIFGGFFYAMAAVATRQLCEGESTLCLVAFLMIAQSLLGVIALTVLTWISPEVPEGSAGFVLRGWVSTIGPALPSIFLQAIGSIFGIGLIIRAYQLGQASYVAVYEYSVFIFGPFFAWLLIGQQVNLTQFFGILLIASAGTLIALRSTKLDQEITDT